MEVLELEPAAAVVTPPPRLCLCGCGKPVESRSGPGRPAVYATPECRRRAEYRVRQAARPVRGRPVNDPRDSRDTLSVRVADPLRLARGWFYWRYPEHYQQAGDVRNPTGFRTFLGQHRYPATVRRYQGLTVKTIRQSDVEIAELTTWIRGLPAYQRADFASRAIEARLSGHIMEQSPDRPVSHGATLDRRADPITLGQLRAFYRPGECLEAGCHGDVHARGLCRSCYDAFRNGAMAQ